MGLRVTEHRQDRSSESPLEATALGSASASAREMLPPTADAARSYLNALVEKHALAERWKDGGIGLLEDALDLTARAASFGPVGVDHLHQLPEQARAGVAQLLTVCNDPQLQSWLGPDLVYFVARAALSKDFPWTGGFSSLPQRLEEMFRSSPLSEQVLASAREWRRYCPEVTETVANESFSGLCRLLRRGMEYREMPHKDLRMIMMRHFKRQLPAAQSSFEAIVSEASLVVLTESSLQHHIFPREGDHYFALGVYFDREKGRLIGAWPLADAPLAFALCHRGRPFVLTSVRAVSGTRALIVQNQAVRWVAVESHSLSPDLSLVLEDAGLVVKRPDESVAIAAERGAPLSRQLDRTPGSQKVHASAHPLLKKFDCPSLMLDAASSVLSAWGFDTSVLSDEGAAAYPERHDAHRNRLLPERFHAWYSGAAASIGLDIHGKHAPPTRHELRRSSRLHLPGTPAESPSTPLAALQPQATKHAATSHIAVRVSEGELEEERN